MYLFLAMFNCKFKVTVPANVESRGLVVVLVSRGPHGVFEGFGFGVEGAVLALRGETQEFLVPKCALQEFRAVAGGKLPVWDFVELVSNPNQ